MGFIPEGGCWYLADVVLEHIIEGDPRNVIHINTHLVEAGGPDEAYEKAVDLGRRSEQEYVNTGSRRVRVVFRGLRGLDVIHEPLEDGAEIAYSESVGISEEQLSQWVVPRHRLGVFRPRQPKRDGPNYMPASIMSQLEAEGVGRADLEERG